MSHTHADEIRNRNRELAIDADHAIEQIRAQLKIYANEASGRIARIMKVKRLAMEAIYDPTPQLIDVMPGLSREDQALIKSPTRGLTPSI